MKPLSENKMALFNIASTILVAGINFLTIPIFTRVLDTDGYGIVSIYVAWVQIITIFVGMKADGSVGSAKANLPEEEQDSYHFNIGLLGLLSFVVIILLAIVFLDPLSELLDMSQTLLLCAVVQSFGGFLIALFNKRFIFKKEAQKNFAVSVGLCLSTTILSLALVFLASGDDGYYGRVFGLMIPNILIGAGLLLNLGIRTKGHLNISYWRFCLLLTLPLIFHGLSQLVLAQTGKIAIQQFYGYSEAGIYSIGVTMASLLNSIYLALNNAFVPFMYDDLAGKSSEEIKQSHFRNYFTSFTFGVCAFMMMSPEILKIMSTESYWSAIDTLPFLIVGQYCVFLYSFPVNYEFYKMKTSSIAVGTVLAAVLNIVITLVLVPSLGMMGAAISTMVAYIGLFLFHFCMARFRLGDRNYPAKYYGFGLTLVVAFGIAFYLLSSFAIVRWLLGVILVAIVGFRVYKTRTIF